MPASLDANGTTFISAFSLMRIDVIFQCLFINQFALKKKLIDFFTKGWK